MNCWFRASVTDSFGELTTVRDGLGLLEGTACPHYDGEASRRPALHRALESGFPAGYAADDGAAFHFIGRELVGAVSSRRGAKAYRVALQEERVSEDVVATRFLGD